jgi:hypothetical protein
MPADVGCCFLFFGLFLSSAEIRLSVGFGLGFGIAIGFYW